MTKNHNVWARFWFKRRWWRYWNMWIWFGYYYWQII